MYYLQACDMWKCNTLPFLSSITVLSQMHAGSDALVSFFTSTAAHSRREISISQVSLLSLSKPSYPPTNPAHPHPKKACFPLKKKCKVLQAQLKSTYTNLKIYAPGTLLANIYINQSVKVWYGHYFRCDILKKEVPPPQKKAPLCLLNLLPFTKTNKKQISHSLSGKSAHYNSHLKVILSVPFSYKLHTAEAHTQQDKNKKQKQHVYNQFFRQTDKVTKHNTKPEADVKMPGLSDVEGVSARVTCPPSGWVVGTVPT